MNACSRLTHVSPKSKLSHSYKHTYIHERQALSWLPTLYAKSHNVLQHQNTRQSALPRHMFGIVACMRRTPCCLRNVTMTCMGMAYMVCGDYDILFKAPGSICQCLEWHRHYTRVVRHFLMQVPVQLLPHNLHDTSALQTSKSQLSLNRRQMVNQIAVHAIPMWQQNSLPWQTNLLCWNLLCISRIPVSNLISYQTLKIKNTKAARTLAPTINQTTQTKLYV